MYHLSNLDFLEDGSVVVDVSAGEEAVEVSAISRLDDAEPPAELSCHPHLRGGMCKVRGKTTKNLADNC